MFYAKYTNEIGELIKNALKDKDRASLNVLKGLKDAVQKAEKEKMAPLTEDDFAAVVAKEVKGYRDTQMWAGHDDRADIYAETTHALKLLEMFMPKQATAEEIETYVKGLLTVGIEYASADMGSIMTHMKAKFDGRADMKMVAGIVRANIGK